MILLQVQTAKLYFLISWYNDLCFIRWFNIPTSKITEQPTMDG